MLVVVWGGSFIQLLPLPQQSAYVCVCGGKRLTSALASAVCLCLCVWTEATNFCPCLSSLPMFVSVWGGAEAINSSLALTVCLCLFVCVGGGGGGGEGGSD